jgi:hypothetical protein
VPSIMNVLYDILLCRGQALIWMIADIADGEGPMKSGLLVQETGVKESHVN